MLRILTVVGARPQFVKAAVVSRAIARSGSALESIVHTGQHYDDNMSDQFFRELEIPKPSSNLGVGGGTHGENTGRMLEGIERIVLAERPDWVLVYGDTDSTIAGALAAIKQHVRVAHVEAGLRSFNRAMPEEINRVLTDHASTLLLAPTAAAEANLHRENIPAARIRLVGDVMYDAALYFARKAEAESGILSRLGLEPGKFVLLTVHRPSNTDDAERLMRILEAVECAPDRVVWPVHPRNRARLRTLTSRMPKQLLLTDPVGYLDMTMLEKNARLIATDSGGVQKEAFFHSVPCVTLRSETEWVELIAIGANRLAGDRLEVFRSSLAETPRFPAADDRRLYGDGDAASRILAALGGWQVNDL